MPDIDGLVARILALNQDPSLRTAGGFQLESYPPVEMEVIESAESMLGFELPELLRHFYRRVANGGFGVSKLSLSVILVTIDSTISITVDTGNLTSFNTTVIILTIVVDICF